MAKLKMKKIEIIASIQDVKNIVDFIQRKEVMELTDIPENGNLDKISTVQSLGFYDKYLTEAKTSLEVLDKYCPESKGILESFFPQKENISFKEFIDNSDKASDILGVCYDINSAAKQIDESSSSVARYEAMLETLEPWIDLDVPMKYKGTKTTSAFIGTLPDYYTAETLKDALLPALGEIEEFDCEVISSGKTRSNVFVVCHNSRRR